MASDESKELLGYVVTPIYESKYSVHRVYERNDECCEGHGADVLLIATFIALSLAILAGFIVPLAQIRNPRFDEQYEPPPLYAAFAKGKSPCDERVDAMYFLRGAIFDHHEPLWRERYSVDYICNNTSTDTSQENSQFLKSECELIRSFEDARNLIAVAFAIAAIALISLVFSKWTKSMIMIHCIIHLFLVLAIILQFAAVISIAVRAHHIESASQSSHAGVSHPVKIGPIGVSAVCCAATSGVLQFALIVLRIRLDHIDG